MTPTEQLVNFLINNRKAVEAGDVILAENVASMERILKDLRAMRPDIPVEELTSHLRRTDFHTAISMLGATLAADLLKEIVKEYVKLRDKASRKPKLYQRWWWAVMRKLR